MLPLQPSRARAQAGDGERWRVVDVEWKSASAWLTTASTRSIVGADQLASAHVLRRHARLLGQDAGRELLGGHLEREEADHRRRRPCAAGRPRRAQRDTCSAACEGDVGRQRRLAHRRPAGQHDQVGMVQAAEESIAAEAGRHARRLPSRAWAASAVATVASAAGRTAEAAVRRGAPGQAVELALERLDLSAAVSSGSGA